MPTLLADINTQSWISWLLKDETGQKVGIAAGVVVGMIVLVVLFKMMKWAAARATLILGLGAVIAAVYLLAVFLFKAGPVGWLAGGVMAFGMFLGLALYLTVAKR